MNWKDCLSRGVDVNALSEEGCWSGLTLAARQNNTDLLELFLSHPHIKINLAVDAGGVEADCEDLHGNTAGHRAVMWSESQPDLVRILADTGRLDWNKRNRWGKTPLYLALDSGQSDLVGTS